MMGKTWGFGIIVILAAAMIILNRPVQVCSTEVCVDADVVSNAGALMRGLQGKDGLAPNRGMLFVFPKEELYRFWMKDMKFALDILWLDGKGTIVDLREHVPPCAAQPCPVYAPVHEARYVLEVNQGFIRAHGWKRGVPLSIKNLWEWRK